MTGRLKSMSSHTNTHHPGSHGVELNPLESEFGRARFANRELSRLQFADRLLDLATDEEVPVLDRVKFVAIYADLIDEFFQVRVANLEDQIAAGVTTRSPDGLRPKEQLKAVRSAVHALMDRQDALVSSALLPSLSSAGITITSWADLTHTEKADLGVRFEREIFPILTPLSVDVGHPFPYISDRSINLLVRVNDPKSKESRVARVKVPDVLPRFLELEDGVRFIPLEEVIAEHLPRLFPGMEVGKHQIFRITRNADLVVEEDEADDLLVALEAELRRRRFGHAVRIEVAEPVDGNLLDTLLRELDLRPDQVFTTRALLGLSALWGIASLDFPEL
ncbi:MAG: RNA degradosome polyphosphate kinase, partial [Actinomycetota bacterium]